MNQILMMILPVHCINNYCKICKKKTKKNSTCTVVSFSCTELTVYYIQFLTAKLNSRSKIDLDKRMKAIIYFVPVSIDILK